MTKVTAGKKALDVYSIWMEVGRLMRSRMFSSMKSEKVNPLQLFGMFVIEENNGLTMKEFAQLMHVTAPSATSLADRLVRMKWIVRKTDVDNRRLVRLHVSRVGKAKLQTLMRSHRKVMNDIFMLIDEKDRRDTVRILQHLHAALLTK